jgi:hypothetical protein
LSNSASFQDYDKSFRYSYYTDPINTGSVEINFNKDRTRVSGTFSFKAKYEISDETVEITAGEFSLPVQKF